MIQLLPHPCNRCACTAADQMGISAPAASSPCQYCPCLPSVTWVNMPAASPKRGCLLPACAHRGAT